jgi:hypothetical protein
MALSSRTSKTGCRGKRCADTIRVRLDGIPGWLSALAN